MFAIRTQDRTMVGADETADLWLPPNFLRIVGIDAKTQNDFYNQNRKVPIQVVES